MPTTRDDDGDDETSFFETLPLGVKRAIQGLRGVEVQVSQVRSEFEKRVLELELEYAAKCRPFYEHRKRVVAGAESVTLQELRAGEDQSQKEDDDYERLPPLKSSTVPPTQILEFWLRVLQTHPGFSQKINEGDEPALKFLTDIRVVNPIQNLNPGFTVEFYFNANPYFSNTLLRKTYVYKDELDFFGSLVHSHVIGDIINWKHGKNLIEQANTAPKQSHGDDDEDEDEPEESFFTFFTPPPSISAPDTELASQLAKVKVNDEDEEDERDTLLDDDFELGEDLKDQIIPHSVEYFTGEAEDYEDDYDFDDDDDDDDGDEDEDEDGE